MLLRHRNPDSSSAQSGVLRFLNPAVRVGSRTQTIDTLLNENLTIISYDIVMSVIGQIRGVKMTTNPRSCRCFASGGISLVMIALVVGAAGCGCGGHTPSPVQSLEIRTWYDLDAIRENLDANYVLMNDLDSTTPGYAELAGPTANQGKGWEPIGWGYWIASAIGIREGGPIFKGVLDGQGHEIRDLYMNRPDESQAGLFGFVSKGGIIVREGIIRNIALIDATVIIGETADDVVGLDGYTVKSLDIGAVGGFGALVGYNGGIVSNCYAIANITGDWGVGGLVGRNDGTVKNCYAMVNITGDSGLGGLVAYNRGIVRNCYSTGTVSGEGYVGGLVADGEGTVGDSFWDILTSGQATSADGTGKTTAEMNDIATFTDAGWNIIAVTAGECNTAYTWNIVDGVSYPFLSWEV